MQSSSWMKKNAFPPIHFTLYTFFINRTKSKKEALYVLFVIGLMTSLEAQESQTAMPTWLTTGFHRVDSEAVKLYLHWRAFNFRLRSVEWTLTNKSVCCISIGVHIWLRIQKYLRKKESIFFFLLHTWSASRAPLQTVWTHTISARANNFFFWKPSNVIFFVLLSSLWCWLEWEWHCSKLPCRCMHGGCDC